MAVTVMGLLLVQAMTSTTHAAENYSKALYPVAFQSAVRLVKVGCAPLRMAVSTKLSYSAPAKLKHVAVRLRLDACLLAAGNKIATHHRVPMVGSLALLIPLYRLDASCTKRLSVLLTYRIMRSPKKLGDAAVLQRLHAGLDYKRLGSRFQLISRVALILNEQHSYPTAALRGRAKLATRDGRLALGLVSRLALRSKRGEPKAQALGYADSRWHLLRGLTIAVGVRSPLARPDPTLRLALVAGCADAALSLRVQSATPLQSFAPRLRSVIVFRRRRVQISGAVFVTKLSEQAVQAGSRFRIEWRFDRFIVGVGARFVTRSATGGQWYIGVST